MGGGVGIRSVQLDGRVCEVDAPIWVAVDPIQSCDGLGDACTSSLRVDASYVRLFPSVAIALSGAVDDLPDELHVLDGEPDVPFWRVSRPRGTQNIALFEITVPTQGAVLDEDALLKQVVSAAARLGLGEFSKAGAFIERLEHWMPSWSRNSHARLRRTLRVWAPLGIVGVGRSGLFAELDPGEEVHLAMKMAEDVDPDQAEVHRLYLDPPNRLDDLGARITRWIVR